MDQRTIEVGLWKILKEESGKDSKRTIPITEIGVQQLPAHKKQLKDIVLKWENQDLIVSFGGTKAMLTKKGRQTSKPI